MISTQIITLHHFLICTAPFLFIQGINLRLYNLLIVDFSPVCDWVIEMHNVESFG